MEPEFWAEIEGYEGLYEVSDLGRVKSFKRNKTEGEILRPVNDGRGYLHVGLFKNRVRKTMTIHRIVGKAFLPNQENKPTVDHINRDQTDNRACNLRFATHSEQQYNTSSSINAEHYWIAYIPSLRRPSKWCLVFRYQNEKKKRKFFKTEKEAQEYFDKNVDKSRLRAIDDSQAKK